MNSSNFMQKVTEREEFLRRENKKFSDPSTYFDRLLSTEANKNIEECICNGALDKTIFEKNRGNDSDPFFVFSCDVHQLHVPKLKLSSHLTARLQKCLPKDAGVITSASGEQIIVAFDNTL